jgi:GWxTD domain-containing protein
MPLKHSLKYSFILLLTLTGCSTLTNISSSDLNILYYPGSVQQLSCALVHLDDSLSMVNVRYIQRKKKANNAVPGANTQNDHHLRYYLLFSYRNSLIADSATIVLNDSLKVSGDTVFMRFMVKARSGYEYLLKLEVLDQKENQLCMTLQPFSKTGGIWLNFLDSEGNYSFDTYLSNGQPICIASGLVLTDTIFCKCFFRTFPAALPPFVEKERPPFNYHVDSIFALPMANGKTDFLTLNRQGFYLFQSDTTSWKGITMLRMYDGYPEINTSSRMIEPVKYLTGADEFNRIMNSGTPKESLDNFWISSSGTIDRALQQIKEYYNRVEAANRLFLSYCEGWKTDRGIIYIIFGPPNHVYRSDQEEFWTYGETSNFRSLQFVFYKVNNPFTENDYILQRQSNYKPYWYNAVEQWRR